MKKQYLSLVVIFSLFSSASFGQLVGNATFLQGNFLEIGVARNGAFHAGPAPAGYHPNGPGTTLGHVYDWGHDGWAAGAPAYYGDYTFPGTPFEGWAMQANNTTRCDAFYNTGGGTGNLFTGTLTGTNVSYSSVGGVTTGVWQGTCNGLNVRQSTRVDAGASWAVVTTVFINPTAAAITGVYYWRTCDPDNAQTRTGSYSTDNTINYQNDAAHRVMVSSIGASPSAPNAFLALCTKDCRAKAMIYSDWSPTPTGGAANSLDRVYAGTSTLGTGTFGPGVQTYTLGQTTLNQDIAIGLIYNIGTIPAGDSAVISYAYVYSNVAGIDSAFPEPQLVTNGIPQPPTGPAPAPTIDTIDVCGMGLTSLPVNIRYADDKNWTNSSWTWSPSTGLSSTTGVVNSINLGVLPPVITYTITGNDSNINMMSCNYRVMYLTVRTCNGAVANSPCLGDSLIFNAPGDSTAATYAWYGPAPSTTIINTNQTFFKYPSTWADTGTYSVIKTVAGIPDTSTVTVVIHPKPVVTATSNSPLCLGALDTLLLFGNASVPVNYNWSGPSGFASTLQNPTRPGIAAADTGLYTVIVTSLYGCKDTADTRVRMLPPPGPPVVSGHTPYCEGQSFQPFVVTATGTVYWYPTANPVGGTTVAPVVPTNTAGVYTYYFNQIIGRCISDVDSITITVFSKAIADFSTTMDFGCFGDVVSVEDHSTPSPAGSYLYNFGDGGTATTANATHTYSRAGNGGIYTILLTVRTVDNCVDTQTHQVDTRHDVNADFTPTPDVFCALRPVDSTSMINNSSASVTGIAMLQSDLTYAWDFGDGTTDIGVTPAGGAKSYANAGEYTITLIVTDTIGCKDTTTRKVTVLRVDITSFGDTTLCLRQPMRIDNQITVTPDPALPYTWTYQWTESPVTNLDDPTIRNPLLSGFGTFVDELTATIQPWRCYDINADTIHSVLGQVLQNVTPGTTIAYGTTIQLNSDNEVYYHWVPNDGSIDNPNINNPSAAPLQTTVYTVYGMDKYGCVDSAFVTVKVDSTVSEGIPSAFTPNGDGLNDVFRPVGLNYQRLVEFRIYNRWGQQVYYTRDAKAGWDGTWNGVPQDMGVYHYHVIVAHPDGNNVAYKGDVTLIR